MQSKINTKGNNKETGNVLGCVLATILIVSLIGAIVLRNATTRLNVSTNQVRGWKRAPPPKQAVTLRLPRLGSN